MNKADYANAAEALPHQAIALKLCELVGVDLMKVVSVDLHGDAHDYPIVTFAVRLNNDDIRAVLGQQQDDSAAGVFVSHEGE